MDVVLICMEATSKFFSYGTKFYFKILNEMYDNETCKDSEIVLEEINSLISICLWIYLACALPILSLCLQEILNFMSSLRKKNMRTRVKNHFVSQQKRNTFYEVLNSAYKKKTPYNINDQ